jgi:hypothetical protein
MFDELVDVVSGRGLSHWRTRFWGTVNSMATRKITVSLDATALSLAERAAARDGLSMSAWLSRAARREAVRTGAGPVGVDGLADALADEAELIEAERDMRAAG